MEWAVDWMTPEMLKNLCPYCADGHKSQYDRVHDELIHELPAEMFGVPYVVTCFGTRYMKSKRKETCLSGCHTQMLRGTKC